MEINELIACAKRELAMRERVYPQLVARGRMTQTRADHELEAMKNIASVLEFVSGMLREWLTGPQGGRNE